MAVAECIAAPANQTEPRAISTGYTFSCSVIGRNAEVVLIGDLTDEIRGSLDDQFWDVIQHCDRLTINCTQAPFISRSCQATIDGIMDIMGRSHATLIRGGS